MERLECIYKYMNIEIHKCIYIYIHICKHKYEYKQQTNKLMCVYIYIFYI